MSCHVRLVARIVCDGSWDVRIGILTSVVRPACCLYVPILRLFLFLVYLNVVTLTRPATFAIYCLAFRANRW